LSWVLIVFALFAFASAGFLHEKHSLMGEFVRFVKTHDKTYGTMEEFNLRFTIFADAYIKLNLQPTDKFSQFMDLTTEEFEKRLVIDASAYSAAVSQMTPYKFKFPHEEVPASHDWRDHAGVVGEVKNQASCGSCWAFSAVSNMESLYAIKHGKSLILSEQQIVDCDKVSIGCGGGWMDNAFKYIQTFGGLESEQDYPYEAKTQTCRNDISKAQLQVTGHHSISKNEEDIKKAVFENGPLSVAINAKPFHYYTGGIITEPCAAALNHGVVIVGYGSEEGVDFWIIRNSWGGNWGEKGYARMIRGKGECGINTTVSTAEVA